MTRNRGANSPKSLFGILAVAVILIFSSVHVLWAQADSTEQKTISEDSGQEVSRLESIIVTAQKQAEDVQEAPLSISVFDKMDLEDREINTISDLDDYVPNFLIFNHGSDVKNTPTMRGISAPAHSMRVSTGLFIDGVPVLSILGYDDALMDIERIEILRGPQGTLYGKGTETGAVNIITRQPDNEVRGRVSVSVGSLLSGEGDRNLTGDVSANLSVPLKKDRWYLAVAGRFEGMDGFIEDTNTGDTADTREHWYGRAHLRWTPSQGMDISFIASGFKFNNGSERLNLGALGAATFMMTPNEPYKITPNVTSFFKPESSTQALKIDYDISPELTLTSVSTHWRYSESSQYDYDFSQFTISHTLGEAELEKYSQELRLSGANGPVRWLTGVYLDRIDNSSNYETTLAGDSIQSYDGNTWALFGNLTWSATERLDVVAGLRYEKETQDFSDKVIGVETDGDWSGATPKAALEYKMTSDVMAYVSATKGYRSGGFNLLITDPDYIGYDQEKLWSYELGTKCVFFNNRLMVNGSLYYMDIEDMQVEIAYATGRRATTNAAEATGKGAELEVTANVADGLSVTAGYGYSDIEFDAYSDLSGDYKGNKNPWAPEYTYNLGAQYRSDSGFFWRADLVGCGKLYFDQANLYSRDPYEVVNGKIGYESKHFDVYLYGRNIFDQDYSSDEYYSGYYTVYSDPGEIGLQFTTRF